jgi:predicted GH43/DUF377 family glycosyl hydrolase
VTPAAAIGRCECPVPAGPWSPGTCRLCWLRANPGREADPLLLPPVPVRSPAPPKARPTGPAPLRPYGKCAYTGDLIEKVTGCNGGPKCVFECDHPDPGTQTLHPRCIPLAQWPHCPHWSATVDAARVAAELVRAAPPRPQPAAPGPVRRVTVDAAKLAPGVAFNASAIEYKGRVLMAYRTGWAGANVHVCELHGPDYAPGRSTTLHRLRCGDARYGREDPRLFLQGGRLHVAFVGVQGSRRGGWNGTRQLFARLSDSLRVEDVFAPVWRGAKRNREKNWSFFDGGDGLRAVYSIKPHMVLDVRSNAATVAHRTYHAAPWAGGHLRGGASPVRVGDEWYSWFHGKIDRGPSHEWEYSVGVYTFDARPPYRVRRITPVPLLRSDPATRPADQYCPVVFPCGAFLRGDRRAGTWVVSMGVHDRHIEIAEWDAAAVESSLVEVRP